MEPRAVPSRKPQTIRVLFVIMILNLLFLSAGLVLMVIFTFEGFKAGEMGLIVGILSLFGFIFNLALGIFLFFIIRGIARMKRQAVILAIVFTSVEIFLSIPFITLGILPFLGIMTWQFFTLVLEIMCMKSVPAVAAV